MSRDRTWVVGLIATAANVSKGIAEGVVDRLMEEGVLHLGYGDADIDIVVQSFTDAFGATKVSRADRWAAGRLVKAHSAQGVVGIVRLLAQHSGEQYVPVVNNVAELENKFLSVLHFLRKTSGQDDIIEVG